jgi:coproporphyrinogen III oxidase-like Fe-S oxidoreductase
MSAVRSLGIYIHIPVCSSLCGYCDFYSVRQNEIDKSFWQKYLLRLKEEFKFKEACVNKKHA